MAGPAIPVPTPLSLEPLTPDLLGAAQAGDRALGVALDAVLAPGWDVFPGSLAASPPVPWGTWLFVALEPRTLVGYGGFKGPPRGGEVEIGFAIAPAWRGRGLATEAAAELVDRAFAEPGVERVIAHTLAGENASTRVLARLGFARAADIVDPDDGPLWRWVRDRHGADGFLGAWVLDAARCRYEAGEPPRDGLYVLAPRPDGIAFTVDWTDPEGNARHVAFDTVFGERDGLVLERPSPDTLITRAPAGPIRFARRTLLPGRREMVISQEGLRSDGSPFANVSAYVRAAWSWGTG